MSQDLCNVPLNVIPMRQNISLLYIKFNSHFCCMLRKKQTKKKTPFQYKTVNMQHAKSLASLYLHFLHLNLCECLIYDAVMIFFKSGLVKFQP